MVTSGGPELVKLTAGPLSLALSPRIGGSIAAFDWIEGGRRTPILRDSDGEPAEALGAASFPLVPFVNRVRGGEFEFRGRTVRLAPNMAGDPSPIHGQAWLGAWEVVEHGGERAHLRFEHESSEWPWDYVVDQHFGVTSDALEVTLSCVNRSSDPMPCGLGQHPYFHCGPATRIETHVESVWLIDRFVLPTEKVPATGRYDLSDTTVCAKGLDHGFGGWSGWARLSDPDWPFGLTLSSPDAAFFQLYSPREGGIFVAEPVTHANAALNAPEDQWAELGVRVLDPGESMSMTMRIDVSAAQRE